MFNKVLIANRGAIATRVTRTLQSLGVKAMAVFAEADRDSLHVSHADEAFCLGEGSARDTYLNQEKLFALMEEHGVDAVHPGYGFLSENPDFVKGCEARGIAFIGPTAEQMDTFGLKHTARALAEKTGVPLLPGTDLLTDKAAALKAAENIGYPVMLKSTAGGGGIGMQICESAESLDKAWDSVRRLSANNFSNDGVFIEKYIARARHIEVQVFGDGKGKAVTLGERDCSAQRRHQKVLEETPAPNLPDQVRSELQDTARALMEAVQYRNAGTVEFILDQDTNAFYFLEVNTRLQVEHGVTEQIFGVDLVEWMVKLAAGDLPALDSLGPFTAKGHSIQARVYAEDPNKDFQPSAGLLTAVSFPDADGKALRIDHWVEAGLTVSPLFDPMLAKVIIHEADRNSALAALNRTLDSITLEGIETNREYVRAILADPVFVEGRMTTRYLNDFSYAPFTLDVLAGGTMTTVQDYPGRSGYWPVGVPPSGPFDSLSFRLGNRLLGNEENAAGLEFTLNGPTLKFNQATRIALTGADMQATLDGAPVTSYQSIAVQAGQILKLGKVSGEGARAYLTLAGGIQCTPYLGSRSTFTLGQFGGHGGRALRTGDVLHFSEDMSAANVAPVVPESLKPSLGKQWTLRVIYGPHGAPDFFTDDDMTMFFSTDWQVHYNSSRTGIRLVGPKPGWARSDGGEAGMHPSNIHDNAYAVGTVDFTGDMPVILGPDGPSLGGFVCPATVVLADRWKLGQLKAGDTLRFEAISLEDADALATEQDACVSALSEPVKQVGAAPITTPILSTLSENEVGVDVVYRAAGDRYLLVEYGPLVLDLRLRFRADALMLWLEQQKLDGVIELTPGIRSLQVHFDPQVMSRNALLQILADAERALQEKEDLEVPSRIVHIPLSWDDEACHQAIEKYMQSVRKDAPWCPSNLEFIRRINGLESIDEVKEILFSASYVVMGLGDVYLGAPVATPYDPRHRLVTTKYNPARTWTAENSVGIGGAYLCVYGMEGPGGYQFVGRTLQMWNRYRKTEAFEQPWLLRFFDQIRFYEVSHEELNQIRRDFPKGEYPIKIEETTFNLSEYQRFLDDNQQDIAQFTEARNQAFDEELQRWVESGQINFQSEQDLDADNGSEEVEGTPVESPVAGNIWKLNVAEGDSVNEGDVVAVLESMKMEIEIYAPASGKVIAIARQEGQQINAGQAIMVLE
ncbi:urea carboxylase [Alcanivorax sp. S6407]|uniref:urea carboxylase n=1 Tax=Alcanivorax sp. S6407 TaxID=2926424 RepID=UPI001FF21854|nr:urea carboxylase [Alcanivorax sp. S6407]MCK0153197.1 urea carboxylase [Alcanivorax sp. S6407]